MPDKISDRRGIKKHHPSIPATLIKGFQKRIYTICSEMVIFDILNSFNMTKTYSSHPQILSIGNILTR